MLTAIPSIAQESILFCSDSSFCIPSVIGLPRSKGLVIKQEFVTDYGISSKSKIDGTSEDREVRLNKRFELKVRAPILQKPNIKLAIGFDYFVEEFNFESSINSDFSFYENLEEKPLRSIAGSVFLVKPFIGNKYFLMRVKSELSGDYNKSNLPTNKFLRLSIAALYGIKRNDFTSYAFGFAYRHNFGRNSVLPVISINHSFNAQFGFESILPIKASLRYSTLNKKNYFYFKSELKGTNYNLNLSNPGPYENPELFLRKTEIRFLLSYERELHDWLWFGIESGLRSNLAFNLSGNAKRSTDILIDNNLKSAIVYNFSIFIVPPRKFLE